jgi:hypothetical protein
MFPNPSYFASPTDTIKKIDSHQSQTTILAQEAQIASLSREAQEMRAKSDAKSERKAKRDGEIDKLKKVVAKRDGEMEELKKMMAKEMEELKNFVGLKDTVSLTDRVSALEEENKGLKDEIKELKDESKGLKDEIKELKDESKEFKAQLASFRTRIHPVDIRVLLDAMRLDMIQPWSNWSTFLTAHPNLAREDAITAHLETCRIQRWDHLWRQPAFQELLLSNISGTLRDIGNDAQ